MSNHNNMKTNTQSEAIASLQDWMRTDWVETITEIAQDSISASLLINRIYSQYSKNMDTDLVSELTELLDNLSVIITYLQPIYETLPAIQQNMSNPKTTEP